MEEHINKIQDDITRFNWTLDKKLDEKFNNFHNMFTEKLTYMQTQAIQKENQWTTQHIEPHQEETSYSALFNQPKPLLGPHNNWSMDSNIWHHSPKVDLNKFNGFDSWGQVTQMEHYFSF